MSMYRHRFITNMVALHLEAFLHESPGRERQYLLEADYRSILTRVAVFTGHGSPDSLFVYIDWAWEERSVFDQVRAAHELAGTIDESLNQLVSFSDYLELQSGLAPEQMLERTKEELRDIRGRVLAAAGVMPVVTRKE